MAIRIGTSGWHYSHWGGGIFYPCGLPQSLWLAYYARRFAAVEINSTFYRLPSEQTVRAWRNATPPHFRFTAKASRFLTHMKKLSDFEAPLELFLSRISLLGEKLSAVLFQLPPRRSFDAAILQNFANHVSTQTTIPGLRAAFEFRHPSWLVPAAFEILQRHDMALVHSDPPALKIPRASSASFAYLRRHGSRRAKGPEYTSGELGADAKWIRQLAREGRDIFCFFNNDANAAAPRDARKLEKLLARSNHAPTGCHVVLGSRKWRM